MKEQDPAVRHGTAPTKVQGAELFENFLGKDFGTKPGEKRHEVALFLVGNEQNVICIVLNVMLDVHLVFFLSVSESKRNIDNDMCIYYVYIYMLYSKFIESLFPKQ